MKFILRNSFYFFYSFNSLLEQFLESVKKYFIIKQIPNLKKRFLNLSRTETMKMAAIQRSLKFFDEVQTALSNKK